LVWGDIYFPTFPLRPISHPLTLTPFWWGYFYGATKDGVCGYGAYIIILLVIMYHICWNRGSGTNTRDKFLALWGPIFCGCRFGLVELEVFIDSQVVVEWVSTRSSFYLPLLFSWFGSI